MTSHRWGILTLAVLVLSAGCSSPASPERMRRYLDENRAGFERLAAMANEDYRKGRVVRITPEFTHLEHDWTWPRTDVGLSIARWDAYRAIFRELGLPRGLDRLDAEGLCVRFPVFVGGRGRSGREHGYLWCEARPEKFERQNAATITIEPLDGHWYLYDSEMR
jgi:hypothetical protein